MYSVGLFCFFDPERGSRCFAVQYDPEKQKEINRAKPWRSDPHWFKKVKVSATALIKMVSLPESLSITRLTELGEHQVMHARSGGQYEVMGLMQGKLGALRTLFRLAEPPDSLMPEQTAILSLSSMPFRYPCRAPRRVSMPATKAPNSLCSTWRVPML